MARLCFAMLLLTSRLASAQGGPVTVADAGPGPVGRYLDQLLRRPDTRVIVADTLTIPKDSTYPASVVVIGRRVNLAGAVEGDIVVVGGDLFIKPGGRIGGDGIAIGGGAYGSVLGRARLTSHRDFTFDAAPGATGIELRYRETYVASPGGGITLPALYGLRIPTYDRSNGVSLSAGPAIAVGRGSVDLRATYRSQIGTVDPSADLRFDVGRKLWIDGWAGRETRTNDDWVNGRLSNSLNVILFGKDERNWYRATGGWATVNRLFETPTTTATYSLGASTERAEPARPGPSPTSGPWSITGKTDTNRMYRPNPQVPGGTITSAIAGAAYRWTAGEVKARLDVDVEVPLAVSSGGKYVQTTIDGRVDFPTFGLHRYRLEVHGVLTAADTAPMQRFAYLGGPGTLPTEAILVAGGDELLFIESRYIIPVTAVQLPFVGPPTLTFRHILGAAGVQNLPDITQIVGVRLSIPLVRVQLLMDTGTRETKFSAGFSISR